MYRTFLFLGLFFIAISCKQDNTNLGKEDSAVFEVNIEKWPKKVKLNSKATAILEAWPEFNALENSFDALYTIENNEDLSLALDNIVEKQKLMTSSVYPDDFDNAQIKSRQKVFLTFLLKVKGTIEYDLDSQKPLLEIIHAHNALLNQFNIIMNRLDINILLDEEE